MTRNEERWQILDVGSIWMKEFAAAMATYVPIAAWCPAMRWTGALQSWQRPEQLPEPALGMIRFPLQRGYAHKAAGPLFRFQDTLLRHLESQCSDPSKSPLICSTPFYAPVAERWPGPTLYYVTDLTASYEGLDPEQVRELDVRMCRVAKAVCPNSRRIASYLLDDRIGCSPEKIHIVPNATRESNLAAEPLLTPLDPPRDIAHLPRPIAGVIGNLAGNMDWPLLAEAVAQTPYLTWVFVGPTTMPIADRAQARARSWVMGHAHFTGSKPYGELQAYARCFDVAVLPYCKKEPTYSGSSTRFYEHLAACRPMVATRGFAELLEMPPLLQLVDSAAEMAGALADLHARAYHDGFEALRWKASLKGTWQERARAVISTLVPEMATGSKEIPHGL